MEWQRQLVRVLLGEWMSIPATVAINPTQVVLVGLATQTFVATLSGISGSVVWSVDGIVGGNSTVGTVVGGLYTAPSTTGPHVVTATVTSGSTTVFANASINVQAYSPSGIAALTSGAHLTGGPYNGTAPVTIATDATSANTPSTIVARDDSGNFSAGGITGVTVLAGILRLSALPPIFANNAAAIAGGLTAGGIYRSGSDPDVLAICH
jgi:hypothetical protein